MGQLHRFADQIGMTTAGLAEMGWAVARDEVSAKVIEKKAEADAAPAAERPQRRLRTVGAKP